MFLPLGTLITPYLEDIKTPLKECVVRTHSGVKSGTGFSWGQFSDTGVRKLAYLLCSVPLVPLTRCPTPAHSSHTSLGEVPVFELGGGGEHLGSVLRCPGLWGACTLVGGSTRDRVSSRAGWPKIHCWTSSFFWLPPGLPKSRCPVRGPQA